MRGLVPNTDELEEKVAAIGTKIESMGLDLVGAQQQTNALLGHVVQLLTEIRDTVTRPSEAGEFTQDERDACLVLLQEKGLAPVSTEAFAERPGSSYSGAQLPE